MQLLGHRDVYEKYNGKIVLILNGPYNIKFPIKRNLSVHQQNHNLSQNT